MTIEVIRGDITKIAADAIVNAANSSLLGGGGVDGAIHRAGGPAILEECRAIFARQGPCGTGMAVATTAGALPAKRVIHTVGPVWQGGGAGEPELLASCYRKSLELACALGCRSIAFPNVSTGVYGYPKELAVEVVAAAIESYERDARATSIARIVFVAYDEENYGLYRKRFL